MDAVPETFFNHFDPQEPLLQRWALDLISTLSGVPDPAVAEAVAERLAGPEFIAAIFEHPDSGLVNRALYALPAKRLRSVSEAIEALWLGDADDDAYPWSLTRKLCDLDPQMAGRLFEQTLQTCLADPKSRESQKLPQIAVALPDLDHPAAPQMARTLIDLYLRLAETDAQAPMFPDYLLALAWRFEHPEVLSFLEAYLADPRNWEGRSARWRLVQLAYLLADADAEFHLACDRIEKRARLDLEELAPFYRLDIDLTAFDKQMGQVGLRRYEGTLDLVTQLLPLVGDMRQARLMQRLLEKGPFKILPRMISFNGEKQVGAAVMACRTAIAQDPEDPLLWFELGNIYVNLDHRAKARQSFENAIALAPDAIEAYLMLAQMAIDRDDFTDARRQLERGESHLDKPRMLMSAQVNGGQMVHLYRHLQERLTQPDPDLSDLFTHAQPPVLREEKIGRNDPCPCGSGKKYKRCCLAARK
jgi:tetratricopeptide (TPR) repeat protein